MEDEIFFNEHGITITSNKATFPENKTFMIHDINRAKLEPGWGRLGPTLCILIGGVNLLMNLSAYTGPQSFVGSAVWLIIGLIWWFLQKPAYYLVLKTKTNGKIKVYKSKDQQLMKRIRSSICDLIQPK